MRAITSSILLRDARRFRWWRSVRQAMTCRQVSCCMHPLLIERVSIERASNEREWNRRHMRIVSLLSSGTEIVCALGAGDSLVGRSHECDNPPWVRSLPQCSEPAFDISRSSRDIDTEVNRRIRAGEPLYRLNTDLIASLAPDLIIAQEHCEVCA